jgi:hypothetical protein
MQRLSSILFLSFLIFIVLNMLGTLVRAERSLSGGNALRPYLLEQDMASSLSMNYGLFMIPAKISCL